MKKFELTIITYSSIDKDGKAKVQQIDKVETDNLLQLLTQVNFIVLNLQRLLHEDEILTLKVLNEDDISF